MDPNAQKSDPASDARKRSAPRPPKFDTMRAVGNLKEAEFREQQAVAIVETIRDAQIEFATRDDLLATRDDLRAELEKLKLTLRGEISEFRSEMRNEIDSLRGEMRNEINSLRGEMRNEINSLRGEMHSAIDNLHSKMRVEMRTQLAAMQWRFLIGVSVIVGILGTMITLVNGT